MDLRLSNDWEIKVNFFNQLFIFTFLPNVHEIQAFIDKGATVIANWGMSEIGPNAINKVYNKNDTIDFTKNILGDTTQCETKIIDGQLYVKGPTCIYSGWFATGDLVTFENDTYSFIKRK